MNAIRKYLKRLSVLVGMLILNSMLMGVLVMTGAEPVQAGPSAKKTKIPTRTPTPIPTLTTTPAPYFSPTPGPTTSVDGTWKIVLSPNVGSGTYGNQLNAAAVVSANDVWAVGFSPHPSGTPLYIRQTLTEHWDGEQWSVVPSPNPAGKTYVVLNGVDAISASNVWAVGHAGDPSSIPQTLTLHWDGASWGIVSSPSPGTYNGNVLNAVSAVSSNDVWAVGWYQSGPTGQEGGALTMHWDGTSWTVLPNPSRWALHGVTAISANDVWAVGEQSILHWDGTSWSTVSFPPSPGDSYQVLRGISAVSANDIWAVGDNGQTQHWNGAIWSRVTAPFTGLGGKFNGVAAASADDVWAVGSYNDGNQWLTWIDRYTVP